MLKLRKNKFFLQDENAVVDKRVAKKQIANKKHPKSLLQSKNKKQAKHPSRLQVFANRYGTAHILIGSKNAVKVLPRISAEHIVKVIKSDENGLIVAVKSKHLSQVIAILQNLCYDYKIIKIIGAVPSFFNLVSRLGIVVGACAVIALSVFCTQFVTRVSVDGVRDAALKLEISLLLEDRGVKIGGNVKNVDCDGLVKALLSLDGIAFASVKKNGGHVSIYVKEELSPAEFEEIAGSSVKASKRAVVTRVIVDGGTAVVKYGDVVNAGDMLIDGYTEYGEEKIPVQAAGEVWGKVYYQKKLYFANTTLSREYGKTKTVTKLSFFGITPKTPKSKFERYELKISVNESDFFLPYSVFTYEFREISLCEVENTKSDEELKRLAYSQVIGEIDTAVKVLCTYFEIENTKNGRYVQVTVEAEEKIS